MPIMPPDTPLWHEVVAEEGLQAVWPMDSEETAIALRDHCSKTADDIGEGGFGVGKAAGVVASAWPDPAGGQAVDAATAYFGRINDASLQLAFIGTRAASYAETIVTTKNAVKDRIAGWEQAYAAAGVPRFGKDTAYEQSLVVFHAAQGCFTIMDNAVRDLQEDLLQQAIDQGHKDYRGKLDAERQGGNLARLLGQNLPNRDLQRAVDRWGILTPITAFKTADDMAHGESFDQAVASNWGGWAANIGTGALVGAAIAGPLGLPLGMLAGMTVGAFTSGAVDSLYENEPTHLATHLSRGAEEVGDTFQGIGRAAGDAGQWIGERVTGQGP